MASSRVKTRRGGRRSGASQTASQATQSVSAPQVDTTQQASPLSSQYDSFVQMNDDQKADAIAAAVSKDIPDHLNKNSDYQRLIYNLGMNDKPTVVDDNTFNAMSGNTIYRTVDAVYDRQTDISFTAPQIAKQVQAGKITRVSSDSKAYYGDGIYFAGSTYGSTGYGSTRGDINKTCMMKAKLNSNAKIINYRDAVSGVQNEIASGSKLGQQLRKCKSTSQASIYALSKGYNVIYDRNADYYNVINRGALTMSSTISAV